jgi:hypothetical protein
MGRVLVLGAACLALASGFVAALLWPSIGEDDSIHAQRPQAPADAAPIAPLPPPPTERWSSGGTLHNVSSSEWVGATEENRLATAADWALAFPNVQSVVDFTEGADLLPYASELESCVSDSAARQPRNAPEPLTAELAAFCAVQLHWIHLES